MCGPKPQRLAPGHLVICFNGCPSTRPAKDGWPPINHFRRKFVPEMLPKKQHPPVRIAGIATSGETFFAERLANLHQGQNGQPLVAKTRLCCRWQSKKPPICRKDHSCIFYAWPRKGLGQSAGAFDYPTYSKLRIVLRRTRGRYL